jgi:hypothetical protein
MPYRVRLRKALTELSVFLLFIKSGSEKVAAFLKGVKAERKMIKVVIFPWCAIIK